MYTVQSFSSEGGVGEPIPPVTVMGGHPGESESVRLSVPESDLAAATAVGEDAWGSLEVISGVWDRMLTQAAETALLTATTPDGWSPLGTINAGDVGRMSAEQNLLDEIRALRGPLDDLFWSYARLVPLEAGPDLVGAALVSNGASVGGLLFWPDRIIIPLSDDMARIDVAFTPETEREFAFWGRAQTALARLLPDEEVNYGLTWRCLYGNNSTDADGAAEAQSGSPVGIATYGAGVAVARVFTWIGTTRERRDPTAAGRLAAQEAHNEHIADMCPRVPLSPMHSPKVVIAVHGTMASAVPLADHILATIGAAAPIVRFEHDTWLPIEANARELADDIVRLDCRTVILVAHSRGGLVARQAASIARGRCQAEIRVLTLGTPFEGTELVKTARGALIGFTAATGALAGNLGQPVVSVLSRLGGMMFRLPTGISCMDPSDPYMQGLRAFPSPPVNIACGGDTALIDHDHKWTFTAGATADIFRGAPHDMVVPTRSAVAGSSDHRTLPCTHFNYPLEPQVQRALNQLVSS